MCKIFRAPFFAAKREVDTSHTHYIRALFRLQYAIYFHLTIFQQLMTSFVLKTLLLVALLACFIHFNTGYTLVPGIPVAPNTAVPARLEIRTFIRDSTRLNILLLALERMHANGTTHLLSYYRLSGIHGTNFAWDGDNNDGIPIDFGFCRHVDILFPIWHRPYLSLYEKTMVDTATQIVNEFPAGAEKTRHLDALRTLRLPYWDWAMDASIPSVMGATTSSRNVVVTKLQNGALRRVSIPNPLFSYRIANINDRNVILSGSSPRTTETVRNPTVQSNAYVGQPSYTNNQMISAGSDLKASVMDAMTLSTDYISFSNMADGYYSIEGVHGTVHVILGGNGHMSYPDLAAFDPIFWLHHCNIDRLFAMWQVLNPNSYVTSDSSASPNIDTALHPFRRTQTQYWTSRTSQDVTVFGYTYPELIGATRESVTSDVNRLYSQPPPTVGKRRKRGSDAAGSTTTASSDQDYLDIGDINIVSISYNAFIAHITVPNTAANGSYSVNLFLGEPTYEGEDVTADPNYVGRFCVFARTGIPRSKTKTIKGTLSLTRAIHQLYIDEHVPDLMPETVGDCLYNNLQWRITGAQSAGFNWDGFKITVVTSEVQLPLTDEALPVWGEFSTIFETT